ncbi:MAG: tetratricopeptide repeat protein, partial [Nitrospira sp.]
MFWNVAFDYVGAGGAGVAFPLLQRLNETGLRRYQEGHYAVAAVLLRRAVLLAHRTFGRQHPNTLTTRHNLAFVLNAQGRFAEAEAIVREVL